MQTIYRTRLTKHFTTLPNAMLRDKRLSFRARGVLAMVLSNVEDWEVTKNWLESQGVEGREAINSALTELVVLGYATFTGKRRGKDGAFDTGIWTFFDTEGHCEQSGGEPENTNDSPHTASREWQAVNGKPHQRKTTEENHEQKSEEPKESPAPAGAVFRPEWKPSFASKEKQLSAIKPSDGYPTQTEFEAYGSAYGLADTLDSYRPDLYAELCRAKWHQWRPRSNRWVRIRDWRSYLTGLAEKIEEAKRCAS